MPTIADILRDISPAAAERMTPGSNYVLIPCPFHANGQERTPSCSVSTEKPVFFCHSCKTSGHINQLFRQLGIGASTAKVLVERAGLRSSPKKRSNQREELVYVDESDALNPYRGNFVLDEDVLDPYRAAPTHLIRAGYDKELLWHFEVGYDPVNLRITFPLRNIYGELVGVSGRNLIESSRGKYKIYKQELLDRSRSEGWYLDPNYSMEAVKKSLIWHAHLIRPFFADEHSWLVLTEGFKACMWVYAAGYQLVGGLVGSYLSKLQANLVAREVGRVILFLDNNEAGWEGTYHAASLLEKRGVLVRVARYPDDREQPDDLTHLEVLEALENRMTFIEWRRA